MIPPVHGAAAPPPSSSRRQSARETSARLQRRRDPSCFKAAWGASTGSTAAVSKPSSRAAAGSGALIVLAVPVPALPTLLSHIVAIAPDCPLTDVVSVKAAVHDQVRAAGLLDRFVGGHPMTGTAHSGWSAGDAALFRGAAWVISVVRSRPATRRPGASTVVSCCAASSIGWRPPDSFRRQWT